MVSRSRVWCWGALSGGMILSLMVVEYLNCIILTVCSSRQTTRSWWSLPDSDVMFVFAMLCVCYLTRCRHLRMETREVLGTLNSNSSPESVFRNSSALLNLWNEYFLLRSSLWNSSLNYWSYSRCFLLIRLFVWRSLLLSRSNFSLLEWDIFNKSLEVFKLNLMELRKPLFSCTNQLLINLSIDFILDSIIVVIQYDLIDRPPSVGA